MVTFLLKKTRTFTRDGGPRFNFVNLEELQRKFTSKMRLDIYFNRTIALINSVYGVNVPVRQSLLN